MVIRWVVCPVDVVVTNIGDSLFDEFGVQDGVAVRESMYRAARVNSLGYIHSAMISSDLPGEINDWCVCFVRGEDWAALEADPQVIDVFGQAFEDTDNFLANTMNTLGWNQARKNQFRRIFSDKAANVSDLMDNSPFWMWIERLGDLLDPLAIKNGEPRTFTDPRDGKRKTTTNISAKNQRLEFGEKLIGFTPKGTWVRN